ncbi:VOC family protein [Anaerolineae bacterium CFX9]|jgi:predicted enzyme related to lactoylglutathione lyase|nr:VOC family protein [Anaerolineae bacterium CFX9]
MMLKAVWVEIPVLNLERAMKFYQSVFELEVTPIDADNVRRTTTLVHADDEGGIGISLNQTANFMPGDRGPLLYLYTGKDVVEYLERVEPAGGRIVQGKTPMSENNEGFYYATILDTEGNMLAFSAF